MRPPVALWTDLGAHHARETVARALLGTSAESGLGPAGSVRGSQRWFRGSRQVLPSRTKTSLSSVMRSAIT